MKRKKKELVKEIKKQQKKHVFAVRSIRRDGLDEFKKKQKKTLK